MVAFTFRYYDQVDSVDREEAFASDPMAMSRTYVFSRVADQLCVNGVPLQLKEKTDYDRDELETYDGLANNLWSEEEKVFYVSFRHILITSLEMEEWEDLNCGLSIVHFVLWKYINGDEAIQNSNIHFDNLLTVKVNDSEWTDWPTEGRISWDPVPLMTQLLAN